jgi:hypothetical protein
MSQDGQTSVKRSKFSNLVSKQTNITKARFYLYHRFRNCPILTSVERGTWKNVKTLKILFSFWEQNILKFNLGFIETAKKINLNNQLNAKLIIT